MEIAFGEFVLDVPARTLRHRRSLVGLRPKEFDLLLLLAKSRGAAVSKDAIVEVIWQDAAVSDAAIAQRIYRLRKTLARHDPQAMHIATIPGCGYRLAWQW